MTSSRRLVSEQGSQRPLPLIGLDGLRGGLLDVEVEQYPRKAREDLGEGRDTETVGQCRSATTQRRTRPIWRSRTAFSTRHEVIRIVEFGELGRACMIGDRPVPVRSFDRASGRGRQRVSPSAVAWHIELDRVDAEANRRAFDAR